MPSNAAPRVFVGIDDTAASVNGAKYAALEAKRLGAELEIVHATPGYSDVHGNLPIFNDQQLAELGHELIDKAEADCAARLLGHPGWYWRGGRHVPVAGRR